MASEFKFLAAKTNVYDVFQSFLDISMTYPH